MIPNGDLDAFLEVNMDKIDPQTNFLGKVPTCVWIEPARSDCVSGLPRSLPESRKNVL